MKPATSYSEFKREILGEIGRCLQVPVNILLGDSSKHNYASGRLDHQTFFKSIKVEQSHCEQIVLYPLLDLWYREAVRIGLFSEPKNGLLNSNGKTFCGQAAKFFWDGMEHVDPIKEAKAAASRIDSRVSNLAIECAKVGLDWEDVLVQAAREKNRMLELGLTPTITETQTLENEDMRNLRMTKMMLAPARIQFVEPKNEPASIEASGEPALPQFTLIAYTGGKVQTHEIPVLPPCSRLTLQ
jgi:capsid protein